MSRNLPVGLVDQRYGTSDHAPNTSIVIRTHTCTHAHTHTHTHITSVSGMCIIQAHFPKHPRTFSHRTHTLTRQPFTYSIRVPYTVVLQRLRSYIYYAQPSASSIYAVALCQSISDHLSFFM